ncbi:MAG: VIT1/CCC1 transporter family protein [Acidobacteriota bacterium]
METKRLLEHWQDEGDFHFLYQELRTVEQDSQRRVFFTDMAAIELRHQDVFADLLGKQGVVPPVFHPALRVRLLALVARWFGIETVLPLIIRSEANETQEYLRESIHAKGAAREVVGQMARESSEHAQQLLRLGGRDGEPWHRVGSGGYLRSLVYGFNDGLTANLGLVMAVVGAQVDHHVLLVSGLAGMIADSLSMGSSGYLASKSEQEVYDHEIGMEKEELELMPDLETEELSIIYQSHGLDERSARERAEAIMKDKPRALEEKVRLELGLNPDSGMSPLKEGGITGAATAVGAFIPILPFVFFTGTMALVNSFILSMLSHFLVGASRSVFTGRGGIRSGMDMFLVGLGVAIVGYLFGDLFVRLLS